MAKPIVAAVKSKISLSFSSWVLLLVNLDGVNNPDDPKGEVGLFLTGLFPKELEGVETKKD